MFFSASYFEGVKRYCHLFTLWGLLIIILDENSMQVEKSIYLCFVADDAKPSPVTKKRTLCSCERGVFSPFSGLKCWKDGQKEWADFRDEAERPKKAPRPHHLGRHFIPGR